MATTSCPSSFKVSGSATGSKLPATRRPRNPKPPPPELSKGIARSASAGGTRKPGGGATSVTRKVAINSDVDLAGAGGSPSAAELRRGFQWLCSCRPERRRFAIGGATFSGEGNAATAFGGILAGGSSIPGRSCVNAGRNSGAPQTLPPQIQSIWNVGTPIYEARGSYRADYSGSVTMIEARANNLLIYFLQQSSPVYRCFWEVMQTLFHRRSDASVWNPPWEPLVCVPSPTD
jgi:hypothetical protein